MKIAIHITHTEADDLGEVQSAARRLGLEATSHGGFMGRHHTELTGEMDAATLAVLLHAAPEPSAVAA